MSAARRHSPPGKRNSPGARKAKAMARSKGKGADKREGGPRGLSVRVRVGVLLVFLGLVSVGLAVRAVDLQVLRTGFLQQQGDMRFLRTLPIRVSRGTIFDRHGVPLAVSTPVASLWVEPGKLLQHADRIDDLASALEVDAATLTARLNKYSSREFLYLRRRMNPAAAQKVLALDIPGVNKQREYKRYYPSGEVAAHVLGFTNIDDVGAAGLELAYDDWLSGTDGSKKVIRDRLGHVVESVAMLHEPNPGRDLTLSIDLRIQYLAYRELKATVFKHHARAGTIVVMDVRSGEILAMVNQPSYNPNAIGRSEPGQRRNRAVTDVMEPGSVMKPFTIATALESGKWTPTTPVDTNPGWLYLDGYTINDVHNHGLLNVTSVITESSNVGATKIALTLDARHMYGTLASFGFGSRTGSGFPGEAGGVLPPPNEWSEVRKATIAYGYGISVTALQLARAYAALANDGVMYVPSFVHGQKSKPRQVLDPHVAHQIMDMLETVVTPRGTGTRAAIANYSVAGKTGTSHIAAGGGYSDRYMSTFVGIAPASDPRLVAVVIVDNARKGSYYGGAIAAPLFSRVMGGALRLLNVPPDDVQTWYAGDPTPPKPGQPAATVAAAKPTSPDAAEGSSS